MKQRSEASRRRRNADRRGRLAELSAACLMCFKGYRIIAWRVRTPRGEIDLIARRGAQTAFVEVKARQSHEAALASVTPRQAERIIAAAHLWLARNPEPFEGDCRFDIVSVNQYLWPKHLPNAFGEGLW